MTHPAVVTIGGAVLTFLAGWAATVIYDELKSLEVGQFEISQRVSKVEQRAESLNGKIAELNARDKFFYDLIEKHRKSKEQ
jgi:hypothetical protein